VLMSATYQYFMGAGAIFVYKNDSLLGYPLVATLKADQPTATFGARFCLKDNLIAAQGISSNAAGNAPIACVFTKKTATSWSDTTSARIIPMPDWGTDIKIIDSVTVAFASTQTDLPTIKSKIQVGTVTRVGATWHSFSFDTLYQQVVPTGYPTGWTGEDNRMSISWNGEQLVAVPILGAAPTYYTNSLLSIARSNGVWGSVLTIRLPGMSSGDFQFGEVVSKAGSNLIVASPGDSQLETRLGVVKIFSQDAQKKWNLTSQIVPPTTSLQQTYFGNSIASSDSLLAIGAYNYGPNSKGAVYLYQRTGGDWNQNTLQQTVVPPAAGQFYDFGGSIGLSSKLLTVSCFKGLNGTNNALIIYERNSAGFNFAQTIDFGNAWTHGQDTKIFIVNDTIYAFSGLGGQYSGVYLITKNPADAKWSIASTFEINFQGFSSFAVFNYSQLSLEVSTDHVFIGIPGMPSGNIPDVGAVYVYSKPAGSKWPAGLIPRSAVLQPKDTVAYGYFGYSLANVANTLVVGAPGTTNVLTNINGNQLSVPRNKAGAAYVFSATDYAWTQTTQLLKLQGTQYQQPWSDFMGTSVAADLDYYYSGAPSETNDRGVQAGAVYSIPTPTLVKLVPPICQNSAPLALVGYPYGGTWSGPGLVAGSNGQFNASLVGPGNYLLTYVTPNCAYAGKLMIQVKPSPVPPAISPDNLVICPVNPQKISIPPLDSATYQWYYQPLSSHSLAALSGQTTQSLTVALSGQYFCTVTKNGCSASSPLATVTYETPSTTIGPQQVVCNINQKTTLVATPSGGKWSGGGVVDPSGVFDPSGFINGKYPVKYSFTSPRGCAYSLADTVLIDTIPKIKLSRNPGDYCSSGVVTLAAKPHVSHARYLWKYKSNNQSPWQSIDTINATVRAFVESGYYESIVSNQHCQATSDSLNVGQLNDLSVTVVPADSLIEVCMANTFSLSASASESQASFTWYASDSGSTGFQVAGTGPSKTLTKTAYYKVVADYGFCTTSSTIRLVKFLPPDSIWIPNVFTPNGDQLNPVFEIRTSVKNYSLSIFNRWGQTIHSATKNDPPWDGGNHPGGTYFWFVQYKDCLNRNKSLQGTVTMLR